jgi:hypothetical protein
MESVGRTLPGAIGKAGSGASKSDSVRGGSGALNSGSGGGNGAPPVADAQPEAVAEPKVHVDEAALLAVPLLEPLAVAETVALVVWVAAAGPKQKELGAKSSVLAVVSMGAAYT